MKTETRRVKSGWQDALAESIHELGELLLQAGLSPELLQENTMGLAMACKQLPVRVPRPYAGRMIAGDLQDPLLRQVLPSARELQLIPGYTGDPLGEAHAVATQGLLHKYHGRALLVVTGACPVHCRYCFRRHFPFADHRDLQPALEQIRTDPSIEEVILSGGDPLMLDDERLGELAGDLAAIPHLQRLRVHTRMPVVLPQRVNDSLLGWLTGSRLQPVLVLHANHAAELDAAVLTGLRLLHTAGVVLLNQSVLLAGINDRVDTLRELSEALLAGGVLPYYLHLLDQVQGAAHFAVAEETARRLLGELMTRAPGYLVPRLVREQEGAPCKLPLAPQL